MIAALFTSLFVFCMYMCCVMIGLADYKGKRFNYLLCFWLVLGIVISYYSGMVTYNNRTVSSHNQKSVFLVHDFTKSWHKSTGYSTTIVLRYHDDFYYEPLGNCEFKGAVGKFYTLDITVDDLANGNTNVDFINLKNVFCK